MGCHSIISQAHERLLCITTASSGVVAVRTLTGMASAVYDSATLLLPPIIKSVSPSRWAPSGYTLVTLQGERFGVSSNSSVVGLGFNGSAVAASDCGAFVCALDGPGATALRHRIELLFLYCCCRYASVSSRSRSRLTSLCCCLIVHATLATCILLMPLTLGSRFCRHAI